VEDTSRLFKRIFVFGVAILALVAWTVPAALPQQIPLPGRNIPQFVDPLPLLSVQGGSIETSLTGAATVTMQEFKAQVLPSTFVPADTVNYDGSTWVWGYRIAAPPVLADTYIGPVFVVPRGIASSITWVNNLPGNSATSNVPFWKTSVDQTMHWADPIGPVGDPLIDPYSGTIPAVVHLHGGEVPPQLDGGPDAWYTSNGLAQGHAYYTSGAPGGDAAIYNYPNLQEAAPIWFHDHALGITRLNVYAGLAGGYIITDNGGANAPPVDLDVPSNIIPLVIQDRMFDTNGQLFFPNVGINPEHPFWVPEFVGDTIAVNGKTWPYIEVEPFKYRFLFLNGSNARAYQLDFKVQGKGKSPTFWVISTDGGYLDNPVPVNQLTIMPGERYGVIVDFAGFRPGTTLLLQNSARTPFPGGAPVNRSTTGRVMEFRVIDPLNPLTPYTMPPPPQTAFTPTATANLRSIGVNRIERLGPTIAGNTPIRRLTLNEVMGPGGPLEVLVNNTKWSGKSGTTIRADFLEVTNSDGSKTYYSELPKEGATEVWEIVNITADAHPIHLHLVQFQLLSRQPFDARKYMAAYDLAFPGGVYIPAYGPPLPYAGPATDPVTAGDPLNCSELGAVCGGNPDVTPFLLGARVNPLPQENGWKDTVIMYPNEVTRIAVRWAPTDLPATTFPNDPTAVFPFNPNGGHGFVWHCHIIDHEDNEMMRPDQVQENPAFTATGDPRAFTAF
jgi:FtsP/CotA-like multicopper oxidase with cupredoxin domain